MSSRQAILQAKILLLLGWVDGELDGPEGKASRQLVDETGEREALKVELRKMGAELPDKEVVLADVAAAPAEIARAAIRSGFALSKADGHLHERELAILLELSRAAGFSESELRRIAKLDNLDQSFIELDTLLSTRAGEGTAP